MKATVRTYQPGDAGALSQVMWRSVREAALADYSPEQTVAWLPEPFGAPAMHAWATDGRLVFVAADEDGRVVGYTDLEPDGHIDHLYCLPEAVGRGVASVLYDELEKVAVARGVRELRVEASEAARRFFSKKGFAVRTRRDWVQRGVPIHNYDMTKSLGT